MDPGVVVAGWYMTRHPFLGLACAPVVESRLLEFAVFSLDFSLWILLGTFSILLNYGSYICDLGGGGGGVPLHFPSMSYATEIQKKHVRQTTRGESTRCNMPQSEGVNVETTLIGNSKIWRPTVGVRVAGGLITMPYLRMYGCNENDNIRLDEGPWVFSFFFIYVNVCCRSFV